MISFRLDRFLTIYLFSPFIVEKQLAGNKQIPILMYHSISDYKENELHPYYRVNTSPTVFERHMRYLHENNYSVINLHDLEKSFNTQDSSKYVVITFDDGFRDFYTTAFTILKRYGFSATVFLPTGSINQERSSFKGKECMTWDEIRTLSRQGIIFGSHTVTHPQLKDLSAKEIEHEIKSSKENIEDKTGIIVESFSYPFAFPEYKKIETQLRNILINNGYLSGVTTKIGTADKGQDQYYYPRLPANSEDDIVFFKAKLQGAYNWLSKPQYLLKLVKHSFSYSVK